MGKKKRGKRKARPARHRSPVPPPGHVIDRKSYRRSAAKRRARREIREEI